METRVRYIIVGFFAIACAAAALLFVVWIQTGGSLAEQRLVLIRFQGPAGGVQVGSPVAFNGLRVGQVTKISFDPGNQKDVDAVISVGAATPLSSDTKVAIESEGLMGGVYVALSGGSATKPLRKSQGEPYPILQAPGGLSLTDQAQQALSQINGIMSDNSKPLHEIIGNLQTFSAALSRNSGKLDAILSGLEHLTGTGASQPPPIKTFDLAAPKSIAGFTPPARTQIVVADPTSVVSLDTQRFLSESSDGQLILESAQWSDSIPKLVQRKVLDAFNNVKFDFASPPTDGLTPDYQLLLEVRRFAVAQGPPMKANVVLAARLQARDGKIVNSALFDGSAPAAAADGQEAAKAMSQAFDIAVAKLVIWCRNSISSPSH